MKTNVLTLIITLVVGIILTGALLAPIVDDAQHTIGTATLNATENYNAVYTTALENDVVVELDENNKLLVNNVEINPALDLTETVVVTNQFIIAYSGTELQFLGLSGGNLNKITMHPDGSYDIVKTDSTTASGTGIEVIIYPDNNGDYGAFVGGTGSESFWLDNGKTVYCSFLSGGITDNNNDTHYVNTLYSATNENLGGEWNTVYSLEGLDGAWTEIESKMTASTTYPPTKEIGTYATNWFFGQLNITFTNDTGDFSTIVGSPTIFAPLEYHVLEDRNGGAYSLLGAIPIMVIVALLMVAIGAIAYRRAD